MADKFLENLSKAVEANMHDEDFGVEELAKAIGLSRSQIHRKLHKQTGQSISQFIREVRLRNAHDLLLDGDLTASEVSYKVGFSSPTYFNKCFREQYGYPPGEARKNSRSVQQPPSKSFKIPRSAVFGLSGIALIAIILFATRGMLPNADETAAEPNEVTVAVLPFKAIGTGPEGQYFAEGVQDEILNHLTRIEDLKVKSRTSVERFKDRPPNNSELVADLRLTHYLEGSTQKFEDEIRITVQFIDARSENHLWSETFYFKYENIWDTQSAIAQKVAETLRIKMSPEEFRWIAKKPTGSPEAWDEYLRAMHYFRTYLSLWQPDELKKMIYHLKNSIRIDPEFALGYSYLAVAYIQRPFLHGGPGYDFVRPDSVLYLCNKAIGLDPDLGSPHIIRGEILSHVDTLAAVRDFEQALANEPMNAIAHWRYGIFVNNSRGKPGEAIKMCATALKLDPEDWLKGQILTFMGMFYWGVADWDKAEYYLNKALVYQPDHLSIMQTKASMHYQAGQLQKLREISDEMLQLSDGAIGNYEMGLLHLAQSRYDSAVHYFERYFVNGPGPGYENYALALERAGMTNQGSKIFNSILPMKRGNDFDLAKLFAATGQKDSAFYYLERSQEGLVTWPMADVMIRDPFLQELRDDVRFQQLLASARDKVETQYNSVMALEQAGEIPPDLRTIEMSWSLPNR